MQNDIHSFGYASMLKAQEVEQATISCVLKSLCLSEIFRLKIADELCFFQCCVFLKTMSRKVVRSKAAYSLTQLPCDVLEVIILAEGLNVFLNDSYSVACCRILLPPSMIFRPHTKCCVAVVIYCHSVSAIATKFLFRAQDKNMTGGEFAFFLISSIPTAATYRPWATINFSSDSERLRRLQAYYSLKQVLSASHMLQCCCTIMHKTENSVKEN